MTRTVFLALALMTGCFATWFACINFAHAYCFNQSPYQDYCSTETVKTCNSFGLSNCNNATGTPPQGTQKSIYSDYFTCPSSPGSNTNCTTGGDVTCWDQYDCVWVPENDDCEPDIFSYTWGNKGSYGSMACP